ncbi:sushi domain-containing protein 3 [Lampetra fluviatilis]
MAVNTTEALGIAITKLGHVFSQPPPREGNEDIFKNKGHEIAVIVAIISGAVILLLGLCFIVCCLSRCLSNSSAQRRDAHSRGVDRTSHVVNVFDEEISFTSTSGSQWKNNATVDRSPMYF